ncbi:cupin domain-containing protein [Pseudorhodoferax sp.]|uniref:cupin domain-containing protein n=1 Tax=Pseudorhodoferax sp. TaxID=1993553 RepID=UPI002DD6558C|nr:cupin domain-containing protein [Pseudorhodoferax sp.]
MTVNNSDQTQRSTAQQGTGTQHFDTAARIKHLRQQRGLSIRELAKRAGISHASLALIEKGEVSPSVSSLHKVLECFPISLADFFSLDLDNDPRYFFGNDELFEVGGNGISLLQVGRDLRGRPLQIFYERWEVGAESGAQPYTHAGEEGGVIISGRLQVTVDHETRVLGPGESYLFPSQLRHRFYNPGPEICVLVSANTPPF